MSCRVIYKSCEIASLTQLTVIGANTTAVIIVRFLHVCACATQSVAVKLNHYHHTANAWWPLSMCTYLFAWFLVCVIWFCSRPHVYYHHHHLPAHVSRYGFNKNASQHQQKTYSGLWCGADNLARSTECKTYLHAHARTRTHTQTRLRRLKSPHRQWCVPHIKRRMSSRASVCVCMFGKHTMQIEAGRPHDGFRNGVFFVCCCCC